MTYNEFERDGTILSTMTKYVVPNVGLSLGVSLYFLNREAINTMPAVTKCPV